MHPLLTDSICSAAGDRGPRPPGLPESATGNMVVGPFVAIVDRVRDAIKSATSEHRPLALFPDPGTTC